MRIAHWFEPPHRTLAVFLCLMLIFGSTLVWLAWRWLEQDRALERQRVQERLEEAADHIVAVLQNSFSGLESYLSFTPGSAVMDPPNGVLVLYATPRSIEARPPGSQLYPVLPGGEGEGAAPFAEGEDLEYRRTDPAAAVGAFRLLAKSPDPEVRAGALLRLGRNLRKTGRNQEALQVYGELLRLGPLRVLGLPSELLAREARCTVLERMGRSQEFAARGVGHVFRSLQRPLEPAARGLGVSRRRSAALVGKRSLERTRSAVAGALKGHGVDLRRVA
jgi:hypothetical protein